MSDVQRVHEMSDVLHQDVFYPPHSPRTESEAYAKIHHHLTVELDTPCYICGVKHSELGDATKNPHGAKAMETHHVWVEWSLANAVSPEKMKDYFGLTPEQIPDWVDHGPVNLMVLCDRHHRHREVGIHELTYPIWVAQKFVADDYQLTTGDASPPSSQGTNP